MESCPIYRCATRPWPSSLVSLSNDLAGIVERSAAPVVAIHARSRFNSSGIHWSPGVVITANHTIRQEEEIVVSGAAGERFSAELAGRDPGTDLAVLRVRNLSAPVASASRAGAIRPGQLIAAVGRNKGSVNAGIGVIGSLGGPSETWRGGKLEQVIRLDLSLHPVSSGGAIVDASGELIGMATPALSRVAVFAVPAITVERVARVLLEHGRIPQWYLGARLQPITLPEHLTKSLGLQKSDGLMTPRVDPDAPAGKSGLLIGDILLELAGRSVPRPEAVRSLLAEAVGKTMNVRILRGGALMNLGIAVVERPG